MISMATGGGRRRAPRREPLSGVSSQRVVVCSLSTLSDLEVPQRRELPGPGRVTANNAIAMATEVGEVQATLAVAHPPNGCWARQLGAPCPIAAFQCSGPRVPDHVCPHCKAAGFRWPFPLARVRFVDRHNSLKNDNRNERSMWTTHEASSIKYRAINNNQKCQGCWRAGDPHLRAARARRCDRTRPHLVGDRPCNPLVRR